MRTSRRPALALFASAMLVAGIVVPISIAPDRAAAATADVVDEMSRVEVGGWGSTAIGAYSHVGAGTLAIDGSRASVVSIAPGRTDAVVLSGVKLRDVSSRIDVAVATRPTSGSGTYVTHTVRDDGARAYGVRIRIAPSGDPLLGIIRLDGSSAVLLTEKPVRAAVTGGTISLTATGDDVASLTASLSAPDGTELLTISAQDASGERITTAGGVGVRVYHSGSGVVVPVSFDNLRAADATAPPAPAPTVPVASVPAPAGVTVVDDMATRSVTGGWGATASGARYEVTPATAGRVADGVATLTPAAAGRTAKALLPGAFTDAGGAQVDLALPSLPSAGGTVYASLLLGASAEGAYAARVVIDGTGRTLVEVIRLRGFTATSLGTANLGEIARPGVPLRLRAEASETALSVKAWPVGAVEPEWQVSAAVSLASVRSSGNGIGTLVYASGAGGVIPVSFDNLATVPAGSAPVNVPPPSEEPVQEPTPAPPTLASAGAAAPGTLNYPVPAGAVFVSPTGSDSNPGTKDRPYATIAVAVKQSKEYGTVVLRGGTYHESAFVYPRTGVTIQPYPNEEVWLDGAEPVTGFVKQGSVWVRSGWTHLFDNSPTYAKGKPDGTEPGWQWLSPDNPYAAHPDQVWINGEPMRQVGARADVRAGTFFVDRAAQHLVIGSDPTGQLVEASTLDKALTLRFTDGEVRGIGIKRYATSVPQMGAVTADVPGITLTDVTIRDNATTGFYTWAPNVTLTRVSVIDNGLMGAGAATADNLLVDGMLSQGNNVQGFNRAPVSGALKIARSRGVTVTNSVFENNAGQGPWFDESVYDITFTNNDVFGNSGNGLVAELSEKIVIANNRFVNNGRAGLFLTNTGTASVWNNTFSGNVGSIQIAQDARRASNLSTPGHDPRQPKPDPTVPWIVRQVELVNNVIDAPSGDCVVCVFDWSREFTGAQMISRSDGNVYNVVSPAPTRFASWAGAAAGTQQYATFELYVSRTGRDGSSRVYANSTVLDSSFRVLPSLQTAMANRAFAVPAAIAQKSALTAGKRTVGAER